MLRYKLRTLLIVLAAFAVLLGCRNSKVEQLERGAENVDRHAKEIERASQP